MTDITAQAIIDLLPIVADRGWRVYTDGLVRDGDGRCPICALAHETTGGKVDFMTDADIAAERAWGVRLLDERYAIIQLISASDKVAHYDLRRRMLAALGLESAR